MRTEAVLNAVTLLYILSYDEQYKGKKRGKYELWNEPNTTFPFKTKRERRERNNNKGNGNERRRVSGQVDKATTAKLGLPGWNDVSDDDASGIGLATAILHPAGVDVAFIRI